MTPPCDHRASVRRQPRLEQLECRRVLSQFAEFPIPTGASQPAGITAGPDGNLWFTEQNSNKVGRIGTDGSVTEFAIPTSSSRPAGITAGPDGNLWFTEDAGNQIGRIGTDGSVTEFAIPTSSSHPAGITAGPDGNLWFTESSANKIGRITTSGSVTEFAIPTNNSGPAGIAAGPDGNLWFTEFDGNRIGRITTSGSVTEFVIPTSNSGPEGITAGPGNSLWFTEVRGVKIGQIATDGTLVEFGFPITSSGPNGIAAGSDGKLWFTETADNKVGSLNVGGYITEFDVPTISSGPAGITAGPDGNMWFTESSGNNIARAAILTATTTQLTAAPQPSAVGQAVTFTAVVSAQWGGNVPTGTVTFTIDGKAGAPVALTIVNGLVVGTFTTSTLAAGQHTVTAAYNPDRDFAPSVSDLVIQVVTATATTTQLTAAPQPSAVGQAVTFTAVVSTQQGGGVPTGNVTFTIDNATETFVTLTVVNGQAVATFTTSALPPGRHTVTATYNSQGNFTASTSNSVIQEVIDGPTVVAVQRYGYHRLPTTLKLTFDQALDAASAQDLRGYLLSDVRGRVVPLYSAVYDTSTQTVTLSPSYRLNLHRRYGLVVYGTGAHPVTNTYGFALDGKKTGQPGSDYSTTVTVTNRVRPTHPATAPKSHTSTPVAQGRLHLQHSSVPRGRNKAGAGV